LGKSSLCPSFSEILSALRVVDDFLVVFLEIPAYSLQSKPILGVGRMNDELVLAFPRALLDELGSFQGICFNVGDYVEKILDRRTSCFLPRSRAEEDPKFKQIIPYVLIRKGNSWLHYVRGKLSGEKRLLAKGSMGVGGHINPDEQTLFDNGRDFYESAVQRELHEELKMDGNFRTKIVALLNDDSTPVGCVHLGIVHVCELSHENVSKGEAALTQLRFLNLAELQSRQDQMESWSRFCLEHLSEIVAAGEREDNPSETDPSSRTPLSKRSVAG
jgi:predicted NUDIX family phosphoesterase